MRRYLFVLFLVLAAAWAVTIPPSYEYALEFSTSWVSAPLTGYLMPFRVSDNGLKTIANGGHGTSVTGADVALSTDAGTPIAAWALTSYSPTAGVASGYAVVNLGVDPSTNRFRLTNSNAAQTVSPSSPLNSLFATQGTAAAWTFDSSSTFDDTGHANTLTSFGCTSTASGYIGNGLQCNGGGTQQYMTAADTNYLHPAQVTVTASVYFISPPGAYATILVKGGKGSQPYLSWGLAANNAGSGQITWKVGTNSVNDTSAGWAASTGSWYRVAATYDGSKARLWINGDLQRESTLNAAIDYGSMTDSRLFLGGASSGDCHCIVDDVQIYNSVMSDAWMKAWGKGIPLFTPPHNLAWAVSAGPLHDLGQSVANGDTNMTATLNGTTYFTWNDGTGPHLGYYAACGINGSNLGFGHWTSKYDIAALDSCMTNAGLQNQQNVPSGWGNGNTQKSSGFMAYRNNQILWALHRQSQFDGSVLTGSTSIIRVCAPGDLTVKAAHSTGIDDCAHAVSGGDIPLNTDTATFNNLPHAAAKVMFVQYASWVTGDYEGSTNYIYAVATDSTGKNFYPVRCSKSVDCLQPGTWQIYTGAAGGDITNNSNWSSTEAGMTSLFPGLYAAVESVQPVYVGPPFYYVALIETPTGFGQYVMRADHLSGPWSYLGALPGDGSLQPNFPNFDVASFTRVPGLSGTVVTTGDYTSSHYNPQTRVVTLIAPAVRHGRQ